MTTPSDALVALYEGVAPPVRRGGVVYPVAVDRLDSVSVTRAGGAAAPVVVTPYGAEHLRAVRAGHPETWDGALLALDEIDGSTLRVRPASYFAMLATCDALRAELLGTAGGAMPSRDAAHAAAGGDPVRRGAGRAAAVGVSVVTTLPTATGRAFLIGERRSSLPTDPRLWHVAPSGMLDLDPTANAVAVTVENELGEELGVPPAAAATLAARIRVLGVAHDLTRLRPEVCVRLDLSATEAALVEPALRGVERSPEFAAFALIEITAEGLAAFWRDHPPGTVTPAAAGAVALLEADLRPA
ncbi:MAG: hypothetical protein QOE45_646 [Frankiaceae bacterium]|jgi:hypothetical protein|nr:hypothetical protein [Frankiaceae bacterium]